eukprot:1138307-Rhodomonas_salina.1
MSGADVARMVHVRVSLAHVSTKQRKDVRTRDGEDVRGAGSGSWGGRGREGRERPRTSPCLR